MKKSAVKLAAAAVAAAVLLCACARRDDGAKEEAMEGWQEIQLLGETMLWDGSRVKEPESELDIGAMDFADFGEDLFREEYEVSADEYALCPGGLTETSVRHIRGAEEGPAVYIVGGVHGDERAAWYTGILMRQATLRAGDLYVLAPANANGARNRTRWVVDEQDLNRSFPGSPEGNEAERLAAAIYADIADKKPELVLDLHEAIVYKEGRDFLGNTLVFTTLDGMEDLFFDMLFATQEGELCSTEFGFTGPGPNGSVNAVVSGGLHIPVITVETFRGFDIRRRVADQLAIEEYVLEYLDMR